MDFHIIKSNIVEPVLSKVTVNGGGGGGGSNLLL